MTLDTVKTTLFPETLAAYLTILDSRGEVYSFTDASSLGQHDEGTVTLELDRDGQADSVQITLLRNGTWSMTAHLVVGEKR